MNSGSSRGRLFAVKDGDKDLIERHEQDVVLDQKEESKLVD